MIMHHELSHLNAAYQTGDLMIDHTNEPPDPNVPQPEPDDVPQPDEDEVRLPPREKPVPMKGSKQDRIS